MHWSIHWLYLGSYLCRCNAGSICVCIVWHNSIIATIGIMDLLCIVCLNAAELGSGEPILLSTVGALSYVCRFAQGGKSQTPNGKEVEMATIETSVPRGY